MDSLPSSTPVPPPPSPQPAWDGPRTVNDLHSQLNRTPVAAVARPGSVAELQQTIRAARDRQLPVAVCGGRHAMGGQQFCRGGLLVDTTGLDRVIELDRERGHVTVEAGIQWPALVAHLAWAGAGEPSGWGIVQKQTGADRLSLGGALAANIHGRGLRLPPIVADVEAFDLVGADGALVHCSRSSRPDLFRLAIGGYGLVGVIARVTLRLARRHKVERCVTLERLDDLPELFAQRIRDGCEYGDFQFATDPDSPELLQAGVFSCYRPVDDDRAIAGEVRQLTVADWRRLALLAHTSKSRAFEEYARYYLATDGQIYWSDTHQMAEYLDGYHADIDGELASGVKGSEMISEIYVPRDRLRALMDAVRRDARRYRPDIVYGTVRLVERDDETVLAWAREPWACVVFNLHVEHTAHGLALAAAHFRRLIDRALDQNGSFYLTYHRWATAEQVRRAHPRFAEFAAGKRALDPDGVFASEWFRHCAAQLDV